MHDCWDLRKKYKCKSSGQFKCEGDTVAEDGRSVRNPQAIPPPEYGQCVENCSANMLTGRACAETGPVDVERAIDVIDKLGFVGLTDKWELSVCLWHKKFGGRVLPAELAHARAGVVSGGSANKYDVGALLGDWRPRADVRVFEAASERFWTEIDHFGITVEECEKQTSGSFETLQEDDRRNDTARSASMETEHADAKILEQHEISPIYYLQVPEAGPGFATILAHHACGTDIPVYASVTDPRELLEKFAPTCDGARFGRFQSGNDPLDVVEDADVAHVVMMVRKPSQRILSGYYNDLHDCWSLRKQHDCKIWTEMNTFHCDGDIKQEDGSFLRNPDVISPVEYAKCVENCTANMLTGRPCEEQGQVDVNRSIDLINKIGFVGIADEWSLSVCLWHKKFGGRVLPSEFHAARPEDVWYDQKGLLGDWKTDVDELVFEAVARRFWAEIKRFNITLDTCETEAHRIAKEIQEAPPGVDVEINPIYYLHVPETGSGFATTVAHHGCGESLPEDVSVTEPAEFFETWEPHCSRSQFSRFQSGSGSLDVPEDADMSHVVMMMRDPAQRILSGYYNGLQNCWSLQQKYMCTLSDETGRHRCDGDAELPDGSFLRNPRAISPVEYGKCVANCSANMLTNRSCDDHRSVDVDRAVAAINKVGFVGLTHEWALSVCLWHKRFGGRILASEFDNARPGVINVATGGAGDYDTHSLLGHWRSEAENRVFEAATTRFWEEISRFNISRTECDKKMHPVELTTEPNLTNASDNVAENTTIVPNATDNMAEVGEASVGFDINPIYYLHVPESGSGFATTVAHHACDGLSADVEVSDPDSFIRATASTCDPARFLRFRSGSEPLDAFGDSDLQHVVTMFREPTQRVLSGYYNGLHDCRGFQTRYNCRITSVTGEYVCEGDTLEDGALRRTSHAVPPVEYGKCVENCSANMLTGRPCDEPGDVDVQLAVKAIDDLGFVGLVHEWDLSVCLWHKRFGGRIIPAELENLRPGVVTKETGGYVEYDEHALLGHWRPDVDMKVFNAAHRRFWRDIDRFGVTREECKKDTQAAQALSTQTLVGIVDTIVDEMEVVSPPPVGADFEINPIYYLHMPESGSGLATTVAHHACGDELASDIAIMEPINLTDVSRCDQSRFSRFISGAEPMDVSDHAELSHVVVMLREPSQRALSGYFNGLRDCADLRERYHCEESGGNSKCDGDRQDATGRFMRDPQVIRPADYGRCVENCTANMLTGRSCGTSGAVDIDRAVELVGKLGFVGLTEEWALSVCLWHKRFGGVILAAELEHLRAGAVRGDMGSHAKYNVHGLLGRWRSTADTLVYEAAARRFWSDIERFNVTRDDCEFDIEALTETLQRTRVAGEKGAEINPIVYLHVPESGSGLATTVAHHACGSDIPDNVAVLEPSEFIRTWGTACDQTRFGRFQSGHEPLEVTDDSELAHVVVMMRDPSQRVLSGYFNGLHDCEYLQRKYHCSTASGSYRCDGDSQGEDGSFMRDPSVISALEYGRCVENCTSNMLTGRSCSDQGEVDVDRAIQVIDSLGFVGLTEEWALSICLWHRMFGGRMVPAELKNVRPGVIATRTGGWGTYDSAALLGPWRPPADTVVLEAAVRRFWKDVDRFGADHASCEREAMELEDEMPSVDVVGTYDAPEPFANVSNPTEEHYVTLNATGFLEINPVYFLHVPLSGSGFASTIAHHVCGSDIPDDVWVPEPRDFFEQWGQKCDVSRFGRFESGHDPLTLRNSDEVAHAVVMVRDPSQRILSGYYTDLHDCDSLRQKHCIRWDATGEYRCDGDTVTPDGRFLRSTTAIPPLEYARCVENCTANMLTGRSCDATGPVDIDRAVERVGKLGFVGLTEEWALSVCLWHKRFGGVMLAAELEHLRAGAVKGVMGSYAKYNVHGLLGRWRSTADTLVYEAAARRFWRDIEQFNVSRDSCNFETELLMESTHRTRVAGVKGAEINPIVYLHVPGSGSGLATTVAHHACGSDIPDDVAVLEPSEFMRTWGTACDETRFARFESGHEPLRLTESSELAHVVVMIRDPSQRVLSGYFNGLHDCAGLQRKYNCSTASGSYRCDGDSRREDGSFMRDPSVISPLEYGHCVENCTSNMLTGRSCSDHGEVDIDRAIQIIDSLGFVGLTDEWALSICLWHRMFGGKMVPAELKNVRPGVMATRTRGWGAYDSNALLGSWRPHADTVVLEAATQRFWRDVEHFGADHASCEREASELEDRVASVNVVGLNETFDAPEPAVNSTSATGEHVEAINSSGFLEINPVYYLHVPLSGSGFASTVAHYVCGSEIPVDVWVKEPHDFLEQWGQKCDVSRFARFESGHSPLTLRNPEEAAHAVVMLRDPSQRILSGYYTDLHDCDALREKYCVRWDATGEYRCEGDTETPDGRFLRSTTAIPPLEYARCVENCTANMLTGRRCADSGPVDVDRALDVVDELGFVGISDEWVMSVCLWHKKFGGEILPVELMNVRPGVLTSASNMSTYDADTLFGSWQPSVDSLVFDAAVSRFWREVSRYGLDRTTCEAIVARSLRTSAEVSTDVAGSSGVLALPFSRSASAPLAAAITAD
eukprot:TRINITY_DN529_c0_g1_i10.p1 TRINITY_DN529_c0_g1~~TRINITY_DN529_c0_g1_i10.p1  ORF type:complete len:2746 (+),score=375.40 TRINITY_DN529_c0_g1_i10:544-8238(+)